LAALLLPHPDSAVAPAASGRRVQIAIFEVFMILFLLVS